MSAKNADHVSVATAIGGRSYQEDRFVVEDIEAAIHGSLTLLALFDGHNGVGAAERAAFDVSEAFREGLKEARGDIKEALYVAFVLLDASTREMSSGTTASVVVIAEDGTKVYVATLGDSPVILRDRSGEMLRSREHNARTNLAERKAAIRRGAEYNRGYLWCGDVGVQCSGALGNRGAAPILRRNPDVFAVELGSQSVIILASDGVYHPPNEPIAGRCRALLDLVERGGGAQAVVDDALARHTFDNVTAVVWRAETRRKEKQ